MDAFIDFSFDKKPPLSPLDRLFQQELAAHLRQPEQEGCFIPVTAQTGIGKTYTANALIIEQLLDSIRRQLHDKAPPAGLTYYITNSVDNVSQTYAALQTLIDSQQVDGHPRFTPAQRDQLKQRILYLPAQSTQLLETPAEQVEEVLQAFGLHSVPHIAKGWQALQSLRRASADHAHIAAQLQKTSSSACTSRIPMISTPEGTGSVCSSTKPTGYTASFYRACAKPSGR